MRYHGLLVTLVAVGCASTPTPPPPSPAAAAATPATSHSLEEWLPPPPATLICPERGGSPWRSFTSEHFVLVTDLPEHAARLHVAANERIEEGFETLFHKPLGIGRVEVVELARAADIKMIRPRFSGWVEKRTGPDGLGGPRLIVGPTTINVFTHELAHWFIDARIPHAPPWLNEGLAEYYATLTVFSDTIEVGFTDFSGGPLWVGDVVNATRKEFYGSAAGDYYRTSWALVHMLRERDGPYAGRYTKYVAALVAGAHHDRAWKESFGGVALESLQDDLVAYMKSPTHELLSVPFKEKPLPEPEVRVLTDPEVHLLFLELRPWRVWNMNDVEHDLAEARRQAPDSPEVAQWAAVLAERQGRDEEAEAELRKAIATGKDDERLRYALARLHDREAENAGVPVTFVEPEFRALTPLARHSRVLNGIAWVHALANHPNEGLPLARRAVALDPGCFACWDTLALLEFESGASDAALADQERAVDMVNDGAPDPQMIQHLDLYRKRVAKRRGERNGR